MTGHDDTTRWFVQRRNGAEPGIAVDLSTAQLRLANAGQSGHHVYGDLNTGRAGWRHAHRDFEFTYDEISAEQAERLPRFHQSVRREFERSVSSTTDGCS